MLGSHRLTLHFQYIMCIFSVFFVFFCTFSVFFRFCQKKGRKKWQNAKICYFDQRTVSKWHSNARSLVKIHNILHTLLAQGWQDQKRWHKMLWCRHQGWRVLPELGPTPNLWTPDPWMHTWMRGQQRDRFEQSGKCFWILFTAGTVETVSVQKRQVHHLFQTCGTCFLT